MSPTAVPAPVVVRAELPTPDAVILRAPTDGRVVLIVDNRLPREDIDQALRELDMTLAGPGYPLSPAAH